ncbi:MAG: hypothetical protein JWO86_2947 [Myxococcaceae bacterium]|nr:hypothetical protein [Myxococcaceae bacterium]
MVSSRRRLRSVFAACAIAIVGGCACVATFGCNAITGTGKYDLVDCPSGTCGDGGSGTNPTGQTGDGAASTGADSGTDSSSAPVVNCTNGQAPVTLVVTGSAGSVSARSGGTLMVSAGSSQTACLVADTTEFRTSGPVGDWTGSSCKDGNTGRDRCEIDIPSKGVTLTVALP